MALLSRLIAAVREPLVVPQRVRARVRPEGFWSRYRAACARVVEGPRFLLSFDCDTEADFEVVQSVHDRVSSLGAQPAFAVPGELLRRGLKEYVPLAEAGCTFLNHGFAEHSTFDEQRKTYQSTLYYHELSRRQVIDDILGGHRAICDALGIVPSGFRTPHFGSYQNVRDLNFLHGVLGAAGYAWSSSTTPRFGYGHGPAFREFGLWELPVTGCPSRPLEVFDSYGFRFTPGSRVGPQDFATEAAALAAELERGDPFVVNIYADPSQVNDWPGFFEAIAALAPWSVKFEELVAEANRV